jgi:feruloyl esterase
LYVLIGTAFVESSAIADCAGLMAKKFPDTEITKAEPVASGAFRPADQSGAPPAIFHELSAFCRVVGVIRPTKDSEIGFELWLPDLNRWNGRYFQVGNGGFAGLINYGGLVPGLRDGFAVASTDDGHNGSDAKWALGHPEKVIDYGYRAVHLTSVVAKEVATAYYTRPVSHTYFSGCSDGGRESLMEAQRYPDDFDGLVVGAPANDFTGVMTYLLNLAQVGASMAEPLTSSQLEALSKAALKHCDAADGIADGVIENPLQCHFEPRELQCKGASDGSCLSVDQAKAVTRVYSDALGGKDHAYLTPGFRVALGDEAAQWPIWAGQNSASQFFSENFWPFMVYDDPSLDFHKIDLWKAATDARARTGPVLNSVDPDLSAVRAAGKKIIQYHGWADAVIPAQYSIGYYEAVEKYLRRDNRDFYRLFLAPGMEHCAGGPGPNAFGTPFDSLYGAGYDLSHKFDSYNNVLAALMRWVEDGVAPDQLIATKYQADDAAKPVIRTRPLCVYPKVARWIGKGSTDDAKNFSCAAGK